MKTDRKFGILVLTDHRNHNSVESTYPLLRAMARDSRCQRVMVASRLLPGNGDFFYRYQGQKLWARRVDESFQRPDKDTWFNENDGEWVELHEFDFVFLRLPRPNPPEFYAHLCGQFPQQRIINQPDGILLTGSKEFLLNFPAFTPESQLVTSVEEVDALRRKFAVVLKPLELSGGRGLVRIDGDRVWDGHDETTWEDFLPELGRRFPEKMLAMRYLKNVSLGDKRIIMVNGKIVGSSIRIPAEGSWLANAAQGAVAEASDPSENEKRIAAAIGPVLKEKGVIIFGFDTLADDDGTRILSELNTSCVNGLWPSEELSGKPVTRMAAEGLLDYMEEIALMKNENGEA